MPDAPRNWLQAKYLPIRNRTRTTAVTSCTCPPARLKSPLAVLPHSLTRTLAPSTSSELEARLVSSVGRSPSSSSAFPLPSLSARPSVFISCFQCKHSIDARHRHRRPRPRSFSAITQPLSQCVAAVRCRRKTPRAAGRPRPLLTPLALPVSLPSFLPCLAPSCRRCRRRILTFISSEFPPNWECKMHRALFRGFPRSSFPSCYALQSTKLYSLSISRQLFRMGTAD